MDPRLAQTLFRGILLVAAVAGPVTGVTQTAGFHGAPGADRARTNPISKQSQTAEGQELFAKTCGTCHGPAGQGNGNVPALADGASKAATDGELFWYITKGDVNNGMPSWASFTDDQR